MGSLSLPHLIIVALVVLVLFGRGRISEMMGDFGKGVKSFKEGMADETDRPVTAPPQQLQHAPPVSQTVPGPANVPPPAVGAAVPPATAAPVPSATGG
ncbi:twin-arginine translocase TatA/TatE family subunit, partial [Novosphingobium lentum]|uniref:twin-arginine translocase TatA/TatE family subunit n=1 Tax=Novosphingobium lentum TaxID=145287 RepID=UPI00083581A0